MSAIDIAEFKPITTAGFRFEYRAAEVFRELNHHVFCGRTTKAQLCPNCGLPLLRFAMLSFMNEPLRQIGVASEKDLELLYCWRCPVSQEPFFYRPSRDGIDVLQYSVGSPESGFPYESYPEAFPEAELALVPMHPGMQAMLFDFARLSMDAENHGQQSFGSELVNFLSTPRHQLGGYPFSYSYRGLKCIQCGSNMHFLAAIADDNLDSRGFVGNPYVQVLYFLCKECWVVGAYQECD